MDISTVGGMTTVGAAAHACTVTSALCKAVCGMDGCWEWMGVGNGPGRAWRTSAMPKKKAHAKGSSARWLEAPGVAWRSAGLLTTTRSAAAATVPATMNGCMHGQIEGDAASRQTRVFLAAHPSSRRHPTCARSAECNVPRAVATSTAESRIGLQVVVGKCDVHARVWWQGTGLLCACTVRGLQQRGVTPRDDSYPEMRFRELSLS